MHQLDLPDSFHRRSLRATVVVKLLHLFCRDTLLIIDLFFLYVTEVQCVIIKDAALVRLLLNCYIIKKQSRRGQLLVWFLIRTDWFWMQCLLISNSYPTRSHSLLVRCFFIIWCRFASWSYSSLLNLRRQAIYDHCYLNTRLNLAGHGFGSIRWTLLACNNMLYLFTLLNLNWCWNLTGFFLHLCWYHCCFFEFFIILGHVLAMVCSMR